MVMSYHNDGKSRPKTIQASRTTRTSPGKVLQNTVVSIFIFTCFGY